jgi:hypothetical protein
MTIIGVIEKYDPSSGSGTIRQGAVTLAFTLSTPVPFQITGLVCEIRGTPVHGGIVNAVIAPISEDNASTLVTMLAAGVPIPGPHGTVFRLIKDDMLAAALAQAAARYPDIAARWAKAPVSTILELFKHVPPELQTAENEAAVRKIPDALRRPAEFASLVAFINIFATAFTAAVPDSKLNPADIAAQAYYRIRYYYCPDRRGAELYEPQRPGLDPYGVLFQDPFVIARVPGLAVQTDNLGQTEALLLTAEKIAFLINPLFKNPEEAFKLKVTGTALAYAAEEIADGHSAVKLGRIIIQTCKRLEIKDKTTRDKVVGIIRNAHTLRSPFNRDSIQFQPGTNPLYVSPAFVFFPETHAVRAVALRIAACNHTGTPGVTPDLPENVSLDPEQMEAVKTMLTAPICVLTGGPGRGKTRTLAAAAMAASRMGRNVLLLAPTGRAARVLEEVCTSLGFAARAHTVHSVVGPETATRPSELLANANWVAVDEASMITIDVFGRLMQKLSGNAAIIVAGDPNQLQAVGPGNVLLDLIDLEKHGLPVIRLHRNHRPVGSGGEAVARAADLIAARSQMPEEIRPGFFLHDVSGKDLAEIAEEVCALVRRSAADPGDFLVLTPRKNARDVLNEHVRKIYIPNAVSQFEVGDRIMQVVNLYDAEFIANGEMGTVIEIRQDPNNGGIEWVQVQFDNGPVARCHASPAAETWDRIGCNVHQPLHNIQLAWASTVHKAQGGQAKLVIVVIPPEDKEEDGETRAAVRTATSKPSTRFLNRNLLYVAVTRATQECHILSIPSLIHQIVRTDPTSRVSFLPSRVLREMPKGLPPGFVPPGGIP